MREINTHETSWAPWADFLRIFNTRMTFGEKIFLIIYTEKNSLNRRSESSITVTASLLPEIAGPRPHQTQGLQILWRWPLPLYHDRPVPFWPQADEDFCLHAFWTVWLWETYSMMASNYWWSFQHFYRFITIWWQVIFWVSYSCKRKKLLLVTSYTFLTQLLFLQWLK